jgi:hypothetical protein
MADFSDSSHHSGTSPDLLPPNFWASRIPLQDSPSKSWINRVKAIESLLGSRLYFNVASVTRDGKPLKPVYSTHDKASRFELKDEVGYQVELSFYDPRDGQSGLAVHGSSEDVVLNIPATHKVGAERDTKTYELHTHTLSKRRLVAYSELKERDRSP